MRFLLLEPAAPCPEPLAGCGAYDLSTNAGSPQKRIINPLPEKISREGVDCQIQALDR